MHLRYINIFAVLTFAVALTGCGSDPANTGNTGNSNTAANNPLETTKPAADKVTNDAPTLTPLFEAYCAAKLKKDEPQMRRMYTSETIRHFEEQMKDDNIKTLVEFLDDEKVAQKCEVKNERITGNTAVGTIYTDTYPNGFDMYFEKENGEWKMTNKSPTFMADKATNTNATSNANANTSK